MKIQTKFQVCMIVVLLVFAALPAGAVNVSDATGQALGTLLSTNGPDDLTVISSGMVINLELNPGKAQGTVGWNSTLSSVWYESIDCSGAPYAAKRSATYPILSAVGSKYFILDSANPKKTITPQSILTGMGCIKYSKGTAGDFYPVLEVTKLPFTVPVATPLKFQ